ncbi:hypothetical protein SCLCIDRAFT_20156 [Scleroderma citrinum Foug A]|uniref:Uncharacterized protein n=1 Tax=Scleroderma citrinum Foug A TaxID=1036808 RepID=A0A0C3ELQ0_9AGAM|nr:hypothetical protein SCLCIDRAFT_20156 [Scleroderma citrinum Foug A]
MCNPPFYSNPEEVAQSAEAKEFIPNAACTGSGSEMITPGGEVAFVSRMFCESLQYKSRCRWYTSMLGKLASLPDTVTLLRINQIDNYAITEFVQGQTRRWAIAWSFGTHRLPDSYGRINNPTLQSIMPARTTLYQQLSVFPSLSVLSSTLDRALLDIDGLSITWDNSSQSCLVKATANTWSRAARRRKAEMSSQPFSTSRFSPVVMQCRIYCREDVSSEKHRLHLEYQWVEGNERNIFDSFVNHVNRKVSSISTAT